MDNPAQGNLTPQAAADDQAKIVATAIPTLADAIEEIEEKQDDYQAMYNAGGHFKEQLEAISQNWRVEERENRSGKVREVTEVEEVSANIEIEKKPELRDYIEKIETDTELQTPITDDYTQTVLLSSAANQKPQVKLPLTDDQIQEGLHHRVFEAVRWLAVWCLRQLQLGRSAQ